MQFLINRPNSPSSPHHREKKMLTTLNNLTFDSHTPLSVQRISYSLAFIHLAIPTKSYVCAGPFFDRIHLFSNALPSPNTPTFPVTFTLLPRSETLSAGKQLRPGDAQKRTSIKTQKRAEVKRNSYRGLYRFFGALSPRGNHTHRSPLPFSAPYSLSSPNPRIAGV